MPDREKVKIGLQCIIDGTVRCASCGYSIDKHGRYGCHQDCAIDAIALLKEQEAVEPIPYHRSDGTIFKYECRQCRTKIFKMDLFCRHCGRKVKWK